MSPHRRNLLARNGFRQHNPPQPDGAGLAQLVERQFCKLDVAGSIPAAGTTISNGLALRVFRCAVWGKSGAQNAPETALDFRIPMIEMSDRDYANYLLG